MTGSRPLVLCLLVATYVAFSIVAYTDFPRRDSRPPLSALERRGLAVWRQNNCQACHQIHGFGGFLGPDLTNRVTDAEPDVQFRSILVVGLLSMPALDLSRKEQDAVLAWLRKLDRSGRSQPAPLAARRPVDRKLHWRLIAEEWARATGKGLPADARRGEQVWHESQCGVCHVPFDMGPNLSPDVSGRATDLAGLHALLQNARGRMPAYPLEAAEVRDLQAYLQWVSDQRSALVDLNDRMLDREAFSWSGVPWFEYR